MDQRFEDLPDDLREFYQVMQDNVYDGLKDDVVAGTREVRPPTGIVTFEHHGLNQRD